MTVVYRLVGYDRKTERQTVRIDIPAKHVPFAKKVAHLDPYREVVADYPLDVAQARDIAGVIGKTIDTAHNDYFLEPYHQPNQKKYA
jgi:hypothetical protein